MIDIDMGKAMLHLRSPYLPFLEGWVHALAELVWELVVVLRCGKDPCRWYLDAISIPLSDLTYRSWFQLRTDGTIWVSLRSSNMQ